MFQLCINCIKKPFLNEIELYKKIKKKECKIRKWVLRINYNLKYNFVRKKNGTWESIGVDGAWVERLQSSSRDREEEPME